MTKGLFNFSKTILDRLNNPQNVGGILNPDGVGYVSNPSHGIDLELYIKINNSIINDAKFKAFGCASTIATISMARGILEGKSIGQALAMSDNECSICYL